MFVATIKENDTANGQGVRTSLFVSGCTHHCPGCFNEIAWDFHYGTPYTKEVEKHILDTLSPDYIDGLSLLGGEPFEPSNQRELVKLLKKTKELYPKKTIWCYSGYVLEELLGLVESRCFCEVTKEMLSYIDVLVDGEFMQSLYDITLRFRGSSNQRILDVKESIKEGKAVLHPLSTLEVLKHGEIKTN